VCIGGNHDYLLESDDFSFSHANELRDSAIEVDGLTIYGSPWCPDLAGFAFYQSNDELLERWRAIPSGIDILVTHTPPHGILDLPTSGTVHLGCKHLMAELRRIRPRYHVFGHVHASHGSQRQDDTEFINAAIVGGYPFEVRNQPTVITIQ